MESWMDRISVLLRDRASSGPDFAIPSDPAAAHDIAALLAAIVETSEDAIIAKDMRGVIRIWNAGAERIFGYSASEVLGRPISFLFPPDRRDEENQIMERLGRGEHVEHFDTVRIRKDGTLIHVSAAISPIRDASGTMVGASQIARDITERKQAEEQVRRHYEQLRALSAVTTAINEQADLKTILVRALEQIVELTHVDGAECHLRNRDGELELSEQYNLPPAFVEGSTQVRFPPTVGIPGEALASGRPVLVADIQNDSRYVRRERARQVGLHSLLCVPILGREELQGTLGLYSRSHREFTENEQTLLLIIGRELAAAVERARLFEEERQRTAELDRSSGLIMALSRVAARLASAPNPDAVMDSLGTALDFLGVHCVIALPEEQDGALVIRYASTDSAVRTLAEKLTGLNVIGFRITPERFPIYDELVKKRLPIFVEDTVDLALGLVPGMSRPLVDRAFQLTGLNPKTPAFNLPLVVENRFLGLLSLWGKDLRKADLAAVSIFSNQVAVALENARLFSEVQKLAITDDLTGLYNRRYFYQLAERELNVATRYQHPVSAILMDLDGFKQINDLYGHATGDQALTVIADRCRECLRSVDIIGRYGGEEFTVLLPETSSAVALDIAERLRRAVAESPIRSEQGTVQLTMSIGLVTTEAPQTDLPALLNQADKAMYEAKQNGGNQVRAKTV